MPFVFSFPLFFSFFSSIASHSHNEVNSLSSSISPTHVSIWTIQWTHLIPPRLSTRFIHPRTLPSHRLQSFLPPVHSSDRIMDRDTSHDFFYTPSSNPNPSLQIFRAFNKLKKARGWTVVQRKRGGGNTEGEAGSEVNRAGDQGGERRRGGIRRVARKVEGNSFLELAIILIAFLNGTVRCCCSATRAAATRASLPFVLTFLHPLLLPLSSV